MIGSKISSITPSLPYKFLALLSAYPLHQATSDHDVVMMQRGGGHCTFSLGQLKHLIRNPPIILRGKLDKILKKKNQAIHAGAVSRCWLRF